MPTDMTIPDIYQITYGQNFEGKLQQKKNRLSEFMSIANNCRGREKIIEQINPIDLDQKTQRFQKVELEDIETTRRFMYPTTWTKAIGFDEDDDWKLGTINVPIQESATQLNQGAQRRMEKIAINGIDLTNYIGNGESEARVSVELPAGQIVDVDYVESGSTTNSNLTIGKLRKTLQTLQESEAYGQDADEDSMACCALSASQLNGLLRTTELTSSDFAEVKALVHGEINTAFGFKFIRTEQLNYDSTNIRSVLCFVKSKVCFGLWDDYKSKLSIRDDLSEARQYRVRFSAGAIRKEEEAVVRILCDETT